MIAPNSAFAFREHAARLDEIGDKPGVQFCVQGSVRKVGKRIRVSAQLIEIKSGKHP